MNTTMIEIVEDLELNDRQSVLVNAEGAVTIIDDETYIYLEAPAARQLLSFLHENITQE